MLRAALTLAAALALLQCCTTPAPTPPPPPPPPAAGGCASDAECPGGQVCERCGTGPGQCTPGCHTSAQCGGHRCNQVQCIRCPCPGQCER